MRLSFFSLACLLITEHCSALQVAVQAEGELSQAVARADARADASAWQTGRATVGQEPLNDLDKEDVQEVMSGGWLSWLTPSWSWWRDDEATSQRSWLWWLPSWFVRGPCPENMHDGSRCALCPLTRNCIQQADRVGPLDVDELCYDRNAILPMIDHADGRNVRSPANHELLTPKDIKTVGWDRVNFRCSMRNVDCDLTGAVVKVDLSFHQLTHLPREIGALTSLKELHLRDNALTSLPPEIGLLTKLVELDLRSNKLTKLPAEIAGLSSLEELDLSSNELRSLPPVIGELTQLEELLLRRNRLASVPPEIGRLTRLKQLYLDSNNLASVPKELGKLWSLQELDLSSNELRSLPKEVGDLGRLGFLALATNQISSLPEEVVKMSTEHGGRTVVISDKQV